jgi:lipid A 3-O-deacylase
MPTLRLRGIWMVAIWKSRNGSPSFLAMLALAMTAVLLDPGPVRAQNLTYSEFKLVVLDHDTHLLGGKEHGIDINPELILQSPITDSWTATLPWYVQWMAQPRPTLGGEFNTSRYTNQYYFGATWSWELTHGILKPDDAITLAYFFGPGFNDGKITSPRTDRKSLGSHVLFREAIELGYRVTPMVQLSVFVDHVSNGGLAKQNQSINDLGARIGFRF